MSERNHVDFNIIDDDVDTLLDDDGRWIAKRRVVSVAELEKEFGFPPGSLRAGTRTSMTYPAAFADVARMLDANEHPSDRSAAANDEAAPATSSQADERAPA